MAKVKKDGKSSGGICSKNFVIKVSIKGFPGLEIIPTFPGNTS